MTNTETTAPLGDRLFDLVSGYMANLFDLSESVQFTLEAYRTAIDTIKDADREWWELKFPIGVREDGGTIESTRSYSTSELVDTYRRMANSHVPQFAVYNLVTQFESMATDTLMLILREYPHKLGADRKIRLGVVLESGSIEEARETAISGFLNKLSYMSPADYAEAIEPIMQVDLSALQTYEYFVEVKASRDIFIHNKGIANDIYIQKAGAMARVSIAGELLPMSDQYFLQSYENVLRLCEAIRAGLHDTWPSEKFLAFEKSATG